MFVVEKPSKLRIDRPVIGLFVHDELADNPVGLINEDDCHRGIGVVERIGDLTKPVELGIEFQMLLP
jgi:hypothetical protein